MKTAAQHNIKINIMGREYSFACAPEEKESLLRCAALVDQKMQSIKTSSKLVQIDRIAVMAALMLANDLLEATPEVNGARYAQMEQKISAFMQQLKSEIGLAKQDLLS